MGRRNDMRKNLNEKEQEVIYYAYYYIADNGLMLTNDQICRKLHCTEDWLVKTLDRINQNRKYND